MAQFRTDVLRNNSDIAIADTIDPTHGYTDAGGYVLVFPFSTDSKVETRDLK